MKQKRLIIQNDSSSIRKNYSSGRSPPQPGNDCARPSWLGPAPTRSALTSQAETGWMTSNQQMPAHSTLRLCSGQAFFAQGRICAGTRFSTLLITNQLLSRQGKYLELFTPSHLRRAGFIPFQLRLVIPHPFGPSATPSTEFTLSVVEWAQGYG